jgi:signal transduction histidine kinase
MNAMLEDLLSLGKLEEGLIVSKPETFELNKFLDDFVVEMGEIAKPGQNIICTKTYNGWLNTDKRLLKNILINLVSNAIKFSDEDGQIEIVCFKAENKVSISVKDHGMGISEDDQQHLFERFFRARNASNIQGTGLGLHIVLKYLELIGGEIYLESKLGKCSTFTISINSI